MVYNDWIWKERNTSELEQLYTERALSWLTRNRFVPTNLACPISRLKGDEITLWYREYTIDRLGVMAHMAEKMLLNEDNKWMIVQCATFSKSLNPRNVNKSVSDIRIRIRFPFQSRFWISVSGCKLTILPDIQPANRIVIISGGNTVYCSGVSHIRRNYASSLC